MSNHQERLANLIEKIDYDYGELRPDVLARQILDSNVIREIKAEAWNEGASKGYSIYGQTLQAVLPLNPYRSGAAS